MNVLDVEQGSPEWFEARRGIPTASEFSKIITAKTGKLSTRADEYIAKLIVEIVAPDMEENFSNFWMDRGKYLESEARDWYSFHFGAEVSEIGFITNHAGTAGVSPDGLVKINDWNKQHRGLLEIKCPTPARHVKFLLEGVLPDEYRPQIHGALWISQLLWLDFVSYCPGFKPFVVRVVADDYTNKVGNALEDFLIRYEAAKQKILPDEAKEKAA